MGSALAAAMADFAASRYDSNPVITELTNTRGLGVSVSKDDICAPALRTGNGHQADIFTISFLTSEDFDSVLVTAVPADDSLDLHGLNLVLYPP
jgi:hypothetical protein